MGPNAASDLLNSPTSSTTSSASLSKSCSTELIRCYPHPQELAEGYPHFPSRVMLMTAIEASRTKLKGQKT